jgi:homoserine kinase
MGASVRIVAPATTANIGPGFDCLGMALDLPTVFELSVGELGPWQVEYVGGAPIPAPPSDGRNLVARCVDRIFQLTGSSRPSSLRLRINLGAPLARGLGSSATAIVGGMMAANEFLGRPLNDEDLLAEMVAMEGHPDNVVPCFAGGLSSSLLLDGRVYRVCVQPHPSLRCVVFIPPYALSTEEARRAIPKTIPHRDAIFNMSRVPLILEGIRTGDLDLLRAVVEDRLHEPYRKSLVRDFDRIRDHALEAGAAAVILSGAGPTQLAFCSEGTAQAVENAWRKLENYDGQTVRVLLPDSRGARREDRVTV